MNLVVQSPQLAAADIGELAQLCGVSAAVRSKSSPRRRGPSIVEAAGSAPSRDATCVSFPAIDFSATSSTGRDIVAFCAARGLDVAWVPDDRARDRVGIVAMDMDSTLITIECIDEIADMQGLKPQVAAITAAAMRGEIEFAESLRRRIGLLAGLEVAALGRVYDERLQLSPGAEAMLAAFKAVGATTVLVSGGFTFFTDRLKSRLGLDHTLSNTLEIGDGKLTGRVAGDIVDAAAKAALLKRLRSAPAMRGKLAVAIGDGANDLPLLAAADIGVAYHAKPVVRERATHAIDYCGLDAVVNLFL